MIYVVAVIVVVLFGWLIGKFSKPAMALSALVGTVCTCAGASVNHLPTMLFGLGLVLLSAIIFLVFNGGRW